MFYYHRLYNIFRFGAICLLIKFLNKVYDSLEIFLVNLFPNTRTSLLLWTLRHAQGAALTCFCFELHFIAVIFCPQFIDF